jgi:hypothetical protein
LKYCTARSCFFAAARLEKVPRFFLRPVRESLLREYKRYFPDDSFRIIDFTSPAERRPSRRALHRKIVP